MDFVPSNNDGEVRNPKHVELKETIILGLPGGPDGTPSPKNVGFTKSPSVHSMLPYVFQSSAVSFNQFCSGLVSRCQKSIFETCLVRKISKMWGKYPSAKNVTFVRSICFIINSNCCLYWIWFTGGPVRAAAH